MAEYGRVSALPRIIVLFLLIVVLALGGALWFDFLGLIDVKQLFAPAFRLVGLDARSPQENVEAPELLDKERAAKLQEALDTRRLELDKREVELKTRETEINQKTAALEEQEKAFQDREKSFNERVRLYDNKRANLVQNSRYLNGMPPAQAVAILLKMDDQDMIDHLRITEQLAKTAGEDSIVSFWMSLMPPDRAAAIQRKMATRPESY